MLPFGDVTTHHADADTASATAEDWYEEAAPVLEARITCMGEQHEVRFDGETVDFSHPDIEREDALLSLGGRPPPCIEVRDILRSRRIEWALGRHRRMANLPWDAVRLLDTAAAMELQQWWPDDDFRATYSREVGIRMSRLALPLVVESTRPLGLHPAQLLSCRVHCRPSDPGEVPDLYGGIGHDRLSVDAVLPISWLRLAAEGRVLQGDTFHVERMPRLRRRLAWDRRRDEFEARLVAEPGS